MKSKRTLITIVCIVGILLICCVGGCNTYNKMVGLEEGVDQSWSEVETQYQRRADLIPNLVNTVKGYATHESQTFEKVTEARAKATSITLNVDDLTEENLAKFQQAQNDLSSALKSLLAVSENYPDLKASKNFEDLQVQLEGTENRIATERGRYTDVVRTYNVAVRKFPASFVASLSGFNVKPQFKADAEAATAPKVSF